MTQAIVFHSEKSAVFEAREGSVFQSYYIPEALVFAEPYCVRLVTALPKPYRKVFIYADFIGPQIVDKIKKPFLGCSGSENSWRLLRSNYLPQTGFFEICSCDGTRLLTVNSCVLVIELAPLSWLNGTPLCHHSGIPTQP